MAKGLNALLPTATEELPVQHKSPMTLKEIAEDESPTPEKAKQVWFVGTEEETVKEKRTNIEMPLALHEKLTIMANWEFSSIKEIINASVEKTVAEYEKEHGELKRVPKSQRK
jgi:hypothetical protein